MRVTQLSDGHVFLCKRALPETLRNVSSEWDLNLLGEMQNSWSVIPSNNRVIPYNFGLIPYNFGVIPNFSILGNVV